MLYLCATPIGNLEDITLRALRILREVDAIAAESVQVTLKLLNHYQIKKPLISFREANRIRQSQNIITALKQGKNIALVTDSGMPGISDPGSFLVARCLEAEVPITILPGANAALSALVLSGFSTAGFLFLGFLSPKGRKRNAVLKQLSSLEHTLIIYESPHRIMKTLQELDHYIPLRRLCVARELTKKFETLKHGFAAELLEFFKAYPPKGEITIVIEKQP
jgi:16S rRNA (cytidine1402-2'-O)-methyltransferase